MKTKLMTGLTLAIFSPLTLLAHNDWNGGWGNNMGFMDGNWGNHMGFFGGGWLMILWMILLVLIIAALVKWIIAPREKRTVSSDALKIISERYARGELSQEEFHKMKKELLT